jgi:hypothetical protein
VNESASARPKSSGYELAREETGVFVKVGADEADLTSEKSKVFAGCILSLLRHFVTYAKLVEES